MLDLIARAQDAVKSGDLRTALTALVAAWRRVPDERLVRAIDNLARFARGPGITGDGLGRGAWQRVLDRRDPSEVGMLVGAVVGANAEKSRDRLAAVVAACGPDPRISEGIFTWLAVPPFSSRSSLEFWLGVAAAIRVCRDPRVIPATVHAIGDRLARLSGADAIVPAIESALEVLRGSVADARSMDDAEAAALADFVAGTADWDATERSRADVEASFLARIRDAPDDDGARLVFADWLTDRGDPRGELIALGFAPRDAAALAREAQLVKQHTAEWLGAFAKTLPKKAMRFERGFLAHVDLDTTRNLHNLVREPAWATVESIAFTGSHDSRTIIQLLELSPMRALRRITGVTLDVVEALFDLPIAARLTDLGTTANHGDRDSVLARIAAGAFPLLRSIDWTDAPSVERFRQLLATRCDTVRLRGVTSLITIAADRIDATRFHLAITAPRPASDYPDFAALMRDPMFVVDPTDDGLN